MVYTNLGRKVFFSRSDQFHVALARDAPRSCKLTESGFEYVTGEYDDVASSSENGNGNTLPKRKNHLPKAL